MANPFRDTIKDLERQYDVSRAKVTAARDLNQTAILTLLKLEHDTKTEDLRTARAEQNQLEGMITRASDKAVGLEAEWESLFGGSYSSKNALDTSTDGQKVFESNLEKYNDPEHGLIATSKKELKNVKNDILGLESDLIAGKKLATQLQYISHRGGSNPELYDSGDFAPEKVAKETGIDKTLVAKFLQNNPILFGDTVLDQLNRAQVAIIDKDKKKRKDALDVVEIEKEETVASRIINARFTRDVDTLSAGLTPDASDREKSDIMKSIGSLDMANYLIPPNVLKNIEGESQKEWDAKHERLAFNFAHDFSVTANSFKTKDPDYLGMNLILGRLEHTYAGLGDNAKLKMRHDVSRNFGFDMEDVEKYYFKGYRTTFFSWEDMFLTDWRKTNEGLEKSEKKKLSWGAYFSKNKKGIQKKYELMHPYLRPEEFRQRHTQLIVYKDEAKKKVDLNKTNENYKIAYKAYIEDWKQTLNKNLNKLKIITDKK
mgnify:CR=1 FL=1|tara:strand:- start:180 stop:1637 length:1458 start_codon:yes stop_codon:yes gene_type:complete